MESERRERVACEAGEERGSAQKRAACSVRALPQRALRWTRLSRARRTHTGLPVELERLIRRLLLFLRLLR